MGRIKKLVSQFSRFVLIGGMNTGIDFTILNLLMWLTAIYSGQWLILFNVTSFSIAVVNSYYWNKRWVFKDKQESEPAKKFSQFIFITLIGMVINSSIVYVIATFVSPMFGLSQGLWANLAKATATGFSLVWNFAGYKFVVFKK
ncbi:MAG: GtrA family protein [Parcubacteria group bacterium]|jgi:putative flippase GtrA|nr:GtrA family protein [Parcubacteria group bacterium]|tara:strand:+ start:14084 stop:14515 length:432 start_codon:yes stop_codon:yes gene_type:complete